MAHTIFFDLDNTLYPADSGLWDVLGVRIEAFLVEVMGMKVEKITEFRCYCRDHFSTTLQGLKSLYNIDEDEYLRYVHDVELSNYIQKDKRLNHMLAALPQRKIIFTNADENHAKNVLAHLGITDFFEMIIDIRKLWPFVKPQEEAFIKKALQLTQLATSDGCIFIDDYKVNVQGASEMGFHAILVGEHTPEEFPNLIADIYELPEYLSNMRL